MFKVFLTGRAEKEFAKLSKDLKQKFYEEFKKLSFDPFIHLNVKKLQSTKFGYRLRIGRWRVLFALFSKNNQIEIVDIFLKKDKADYIKKRKLLK